MSIPGPRYPSRKFLAAGFWLAFCFVLALADWAVFYPGIMSFDSIVQYREAYQRSFSDMHPPIMAICLSMFLRVGLNIQHLMFLQCLVGMIGVFQFVSQAICVFSRNRISLTKSRIGAAAVLVLLLTPISPLAIYLMTFWKDVWLLIAFCWIGAIVLGLLNEESANFCLKEKMKLSALLALMALSVMVRHNAIVLLPVFAVLFGVLVDRILPRKIAFAAVVMPPLLYFAANAGLNAAFHIQPYSMSILPMRMELIGLCKKYPELETEFPYTTQMLKPGYRETFVIGAIETAEKILQPGFNDEASIRREYRYAVSHHPLSLLDIKLRAFSGHIRRNPHLKFMLEVYENEFGLKLGERFLKYRTWFAATLWNTFHETRRWVFVEHGIWLMANLLILAGLCIRWIRRLDRRSLVEMLLLLIPLGYYASYLLASIAFDFRYMYPSTLFMEILVLGGVVSLGMSAADWIFALRSRGVSRSPNYALRVAEMPSSRSAI